MAATALHTYYITYARTYAHFILRLHTFYFTHTHFYARTHTFNLDDIYDSQDDGSSLHTSAPLIRHINPCTHINPSIYM
jgi:hypothetical protein